MSIQSEFIFLGFNPPFNFKKDGVEKMGFVATFAEVANGSAENCEEVKAMVFADKDNSQEMEKMRKWFQKVKTFEQLQKVNLEWKPGRGRNRYEVLDILGGLAEAQEKKRPNV